MSQLSKSVVIGVVCALSFACGDDDGGGGGGGGGSYASIADSIAKPTGMLAQSNAVDVAKEYEKFSGTGAGGDRIEKQTQNMKFTCPSGGSYSVNASGTQSNARAVVSYDGCCYAAGCCMNGGADWYFATQGGTAYSQCGSYDLDYSCSGVTSELKYEGCMGSSGKWVYVVRLAGKTYSVTGNYKNGTGTLEITDAQGKWTCTYNKGSGSCSGAGSFSF